MNAYQSTLDYLYHAAPLFQNIGAGAYKEGLSTTRALDEHFGHPHTQYRTIHVAGTNGKGSVSSTLAAILQSAGLRVGLYTSPHLTDFRERIRVNGEMIPEQRVVDFVEQEHAFFEPLYPSFFELTTALAFLYFAEKQVDVAVIEVGLGGRLDCTNIIRPDLAIITNISFDHQQFLGDTLPMIAAEKAGIIKAGVPVVIGETNGHEDVRAVFQQAFAAAKASAVNSSAANASAVNSPSLRFADEEDFPPVECELKGEYQRANMQTVQCALSELRKQPFYAPLLTPEAVGYGLAHVMELSGLRGRWQVLQERPKLICDAGHNIAGIQYVTSQLLKQQCNTLRVVFGMVDDKDYSTAVNLLLQLCQRRVAFYFTQPSCARALSAEVLAAAFRQQAEAISNKLEEATSNKQKGPHPEVQTFPSVSDAVQAALADSSEDDLVFVGGSCYVLADLFEALG